MIGQHDSDASYAPIRDYIRTRRLAGQLEPPPGQVTPDNQIQRGDSEAGSH